MVNPRGTVPADSGKSFEGEDLRSVSAGTAAGMVKYCADGVSGSRSKDP